MLGKVDIRSSDTITIINCQGPIVESIKEIRWCWSACYEAVLLPANKLVCKQVIWKVFDNDSFDDFAYPAG